MRTVPHTATPTPTQLEPAGASATTSATSRSSRLSTVDTDGFVRLCDIVALGLDDAAEPHPRRGEVVDAHVDRDDVDVLAPGAPRTTAAPHPLGPPGRPRARGRPWPARREDADGAPVQPGGLGQLRAGPRAPLVDLTQDGREVVPPDLVLRPARACSRDHPYDSR